MEVSKNSKEKERDSVSGLGALVSMADNSDDIGKDAESSSDMCSSSGRTGESGSIDLKRALRDFWNSSSELTVMFCVSSETKTGTII